MTGTQRAFSVHRHVANVRCRQVLPGALHLHGLMPLLGPLIHCSDAGCDKIGHGRKGDFETGSLALSPEGEGGELLGDGLAGLGEGDGSPEDGDAAAAESGLGEGDAGDGLGLLRLWGLGDGEAAEGLGLSGL